MQNMRVLSVKIPETSSTKFRGRKSDTTTDRIYSWLVSDINFSQREEHNNLIKNPQIIRFEDFDFHGCEVLLHALQFLQPAVPDLLYLSATA